MVRHQADGGIDGFLDDFFGMFLGDFLDVHAAFGADHDERPGGGAVQQHGEIKLLLDGGRAGDEQFADEPSIRAGLFRDEHLAEHGFGLFVNIIRALAQFDAALKAALESSLAAAAGVDLRFDHDELFALGKKFFGDFFGGFGVCADIARQGRQRHIGREVVWLDIRECSLSCLELVIDRNLNLNG